MKKSLFLFVIIAFILVSCSQKTLTFTGGSDNWSVRYTAHIHETDSESIEYAIRYIGEKPAPETIDYELGSLSVHGRIVNKDTSAVTSKGGSCFGCAVTQEDEEIEAVIMWNGKTESFTLTPESSN
ncbi:hypothetical protein [Lentibacillus sp. Marseille-P4043]|uniref:hypothetical protein n=1 Tax=Lentibacillus sp. Marseille-P4043 TaxID=2040293 RepID=UPI000D0B18F0|nr:hypothetical protein [Lentibacillus sp. Marseille-P4043]